MERDTILADLSQVRETPVLQPKLQRMGDLIQVSGCITANTEGGRKGIYTLKGGSFSCPRTWGHKERQIQDFRLTVFSPLSPKKVYPGEIPQGGLTPAVRAFHRLTLVRIPAVLSVSFQARTGKQEAKASGYKFSSK